MLLKSIACFASLSPPPFFHFFMLLIAYAIYMWVVQLLSSLSPFRKRYLRLNLCFNVVYLSSSIQKRNESKRIWQKTTFTFTGKTTTETFDFPRQWGLSTRPASKTTGAFKQSTISVSEAFIWAINHVSTFHVLTSWKRRLRIFTN